MIFSMQKTLAAHNWPGVTSRCSYPVNTPSTSVAKESQKLVQCVIILFFFFLDLFLFLLPLSCFRSCFMTPSVT